MKNKKNDKEWELGGGGDSQGKIFMIIHAKNGKRQKRNGVIKMNGKWGKKNQKSHGRNEK